MKLNWKSVFFLLLIPFHAFAEPGPYFRFIENKNQWAESVDFSTRVPGGTMSIGAGRFTYTLIDYEKLESLHEQSHYRTGNSEDNHGSSSLIDGYSLSVDFIGQILWPKHFHSDNTKHIIIFLKERILLV